MFDLVRLAPIVLAMLPAEALAQDGASTVERLALSPQAAGRMARQELESLLRPGGEFLTGSHIIANEGYLYTRPIETGFPGLCQHDQIIISYTTAADARTGLRAQPLVPYHVRAGVEFRVIGDRVTIPDDDAPPRRFRPFEGGCSYFRGKDNQGWFTADDADTAARGFVLLQAAAARLRAGTLSFSKCSAPDGDSGCRGRLIEAAKGSDLWYINRCEAVRPGTCFNISTYIDSFVVRTRSDGVAPDDIESVESEEQIIVT